MNNRILLVNFYYYFNVHFHVEMITLASFSLVVSFIFGYINMVGKTKMTSLAVVSKSGSRCRAETNRDGSVEMEKTERLIRQRES